MLGGQLAKRPHQGLYHWEGLTHFLPLETGQAALNQALLLTCAVCVGSSLHFSKLPVSSYANRDQNSPYLLELL